MILYYSGTGNSAYVANWLGDELKDTVVNMGEKIKAYDHSPLSSEAPWVIVSPVYAWQLPHIVKDWILKTKLTGSRDMYFILTCGSDIGDAGSYAEELCWNKGMNYKGIAELVMPENYIAMFQVPAPKLARIIIHKAERSFPVLAEIIRERQNFASHRIGLREKLCSGPVNKIFYALFVHAKKFKVTDACVSCGLCEKVCPMNNIHIKDGKPMWGGNCTHCMACICRCPKEAIEYGRASKGKVRYVCPKTVREKQ